MTDPPAPNVDLLREVMDTILAHPDLHWQGAWAHEKECGTAYCFAGWACVLGGLKVHPEELRTAGMADHVEGGMHISDAAARLLRIDRDSANELFASDSTTADLKHYVDEICEHGLIRAAQTVQVTE